MTRNLRHFPASTLDPLGVEAQHPDDFVLGLLDTAPGTVVGVVEEQAAALERPSMTVGELVDALERNGLAQSAVELRRLV